MAWTSVGDGVSRHKNHTSWVAHLFGSLAPLLMLSASAGLVFAVIEISSMATKPLIVGVGHLRDLENEGEMQREKKSARSNVLYMRGSDIQRDGNPKTPRVSMDPYRSVWNKVSSATLNKHCIEVGVAARELPLTSTVSVVQVEVQVVRARDQERPRSVTSSPSRRVARMCESVATLWPSKSAHPYTATASTVTQTCLLSPTMSSTFNMNQDLSRYLPSGFTKEAYTLLLCFYALTLQVCWALWGRPIFINGLEEEEPT